MRLDVRTCLPLLILATLGCVLVMWNSFVGMSWQGPGTGQVVLMASPLLALSLYTAHRASPIMSEICFCLFLYFVFPMIGVKLSYLATTLHFPAADHALAELDTDLGFSWTGWAAFIDRHGAAKTVIHAAYMSPIVQALASTVIFAIMRPAARNHEVLLALLLALILVIATYARFPALGPQSGLGVETSFAHTISGIWAGRISELPYQGIVSFPSYHTVMAIVFCYGHRGLRYSFIPVLILNGLMLLGITNIGGHYFIDMFGGALIAATSIAIARWLTRSARLTARPDLAPSRLGQALAAHR